MNIDDLKYIFKDQLVHSEEKLFYMLVDKGTNTICRNSVDELESLVDMLSCFVYTGNEGHIPRFTKDLQ